ncbi:hypothetical protein [Desulfohalovibrio reitneri]|nr:hypothetical protein [Desulfohalovibrio reitneri]
MAGFMNPLGGGAGGSTEYNATQDFFAGRREAKLRNTIEELKSELAVE